MTHKPFLLGTVLSGAISCEHLFFLVFLSLSCLDSVFWPAPSAGISQFHTACVWYVCVCCIYSRGHYALQSCERGCRARGGNRWIQTSSPFLSVFFPSSFLPWQICRFGSQEGLLLWRCSSWLERRPCLRALPTRPTTSSPVPLLFWRPRGSGIHSCVRLIWSKLLGSSQNLYTHTPTFQQGGKVWICRCSGGQGESLRNFDTTC